MFTLFNSDNKKIEPYIKPTDTSPLSDRALLYEALAQQSMRDLASQLPETPERAKPQPCPQHTHTTETLPHSNGMPAKNNFRTLFR